MATNVSPNIAYVLKCPGDADSYGVLSASGQFSLNGGNAYTFSMGCYYAASSVGTLFRQGENFIIGVGGGRLSVNIANLVNVQINVSDYFIAGYFNNIDITYDKTTVSVYLNGMLAASKKITASGSASAEAYNIGAGYTGYIRQIRLADYALTQAEIGENMLRNTIPKGRLEFLVDFSVSSPKDEGRNNLTFVPQHFCVSANIVETFTFGDSGAISPISSPPIESAFTMLAKIYLPPSVKSDAVLAYYADAGEVISFGIKEGCLCCTINAQTVVSETEIPAQRWVDVALSVSEKTVSMHIDGVIAATGTLSAPFAKLKGTLWMGNSVNGGKLGNQSFYGYLDSFAIFSTALPANTLASYVTQSAFIFDANISAMYICSNAVDKTDLISESELSFLGTAKSELAENTTLLSELPSFSYRTVSADAPDPYYKWEAETFLDILAQNAADSYGLTPRYEVGKAQYPAELVDYASAVLLSDPKAQQLVGTYDNIKANVLIDAGANITRRSDFGILFKMLLVGAASALAAAGAYYYFRNKAKAQAAVAAIGIFAVILGAVIVVTVANPPVKKPDEKSPDIPWPPYDPPKPKIVHYATLSTISYNHQTAGSSAVNIKSAIGTPITAPEWTIVTPGGACALYVQSGLTAPMLKCSFSYSVSSVVSEPCTITVTGTSSGILGTFAGTATLVTPGAFEINFLLAASAIKSATPGKYICDIDWNATFSTGESPYLGKTQIMLYILPNLPTLPFTTAIGQSESWLSVPLLELINSYLAKSSKTVSRAAFAPCVRTDAKFAVSETNIYGTITESDMGVSGIAAFNLSGFLAAYSAGSTTLSSLDAALLLAIICRACGISTNIYQLKNGLPKTQYLDKQWKYPTFSTNAVKRLTETDATERLLTDHFVTTEATAISYTANISDPYFTISPEGSTVTPNNLPYSDVDSLIPGAPNTSKYRESLCSQGSLNGIWQVVSNISITGGVA
jgi:hypothetical protein